MVSRDIVAQLRQDITTAGDAGDQETVQRLRDDLAQAMQDTGEPASGCHVTEADLHRLLDNSAPDARLVLSEGHVGIRSGGGDDDGGLLVISRADLLDRVGDAPEKRVLVEQAAVLDTDIGLLGA
ncbi:hypothetical protein ACFVAV_14290 [Nocardia sp. NPDC057663]|uniref:hypothetical protein n=1 Tax=Nocardia sp. NPDC057663 TaxID=3346201 RepID=UPI00366F7FFC